MATKILVLYYNMYGHVEGDPGPRRRGRGARGSGRGGLHRSRPGDHAGRDRPKVSGAKLDGCGSFGATPSGQESGS
jgi:hypothetical protein